MATSPTSASKRRDMARSVERPITPDWMEGTHKLLSKCATSKIQSEALRGASSVLKANVDRDVNNKNNEVNNLLRDKVNETNLLRGKLMKQQGELDVEMQGLRKTKEEIEAVLIDRQKPLRLASHRTNVRKQRPTREAINDHVERALNVEHQFLSEACDELATGINKAAEHLAKMEKCNNQLLADIEDKTVSLRLDEECLQVDASYVPVASPVIKSVPGQKQVAAAINISPKRSKVVPDQWRTSSQKIIATAEVLILQSQQMTKTLMKLAKQNVSRNEKAAHDVHSALKSKVKQTTQLKNDLQLRLQEVRREIDSLEEQRSVVQQSLDEKTAPLSVLKQRIAIRGQRPQRESVRDRVEEAMETELNKLTTAVSELHRKLVTIDKQLKDLNESRYDLESDLTDKSHALHLDLQCLDLAESGGSQALTPRLTPRASEIDGSPRKLQNGVGATGPLPRVNGVRSARRG